MQPAEKCNYKVAGAITGGDGVGQLWSRGGGPTADWQGMPWIVALIPFFVDLWALGGTCQLREEENMKYRFFILLLEYVNSKW